MKPLDNQYFEWATDESRIAQVGSIYSVEGFEFERVGVIWGEDLVWRDRRWLAQLEKSKDSAFKKELETSGEDLVEKLRNIYRVLLTRGMRSCGAPGIDGVSFEAIEESGVEGFLEQIQDELVSRTYRPMRNRRREIPKDEGNQVRVLSIPAIRDRVVQGALKLILEPIFEADLLRFPEFRGQLCAFGSFPRAA